MAHSGLEGSSWRMDTIGPNILEVDVRLHSPSLQTLQSKRLVENRWICKGPNKCS